MKSGLRGRKAKAAPRLKAADLFCGAGGTSRGMMDAMKLLGMDCELTAINHWKVAIATHELNHPDARHLCTGIDAVTPRSLFEEGELDFFWASPECTHHSTARGGKPINDQSRATAWCVIRWAESLRPPIIQLENVPEFETWGPIGKDGKPIKARKGEVFKAWKMALEAIGYEVEHRILTCADYGDPTTRRRLFIYAVRRDSKLRIVWPDATHIRRKLWNADRRLRPWQSTRSIVDWSNRGTSAFDRKKALADNTLKRIVVGLTRQGIQPVTMAADESKWPALPPAGKSGLIPLLDPIVISMEHGGKTDDIDEPLRTVTTARGGAMAVATPYVLPGFGERAGQTPRTHDVDEPLPTACSGGHFHLVDPQVIELRGTSARQIAGSAKSVDAPVGTISTSGGHHGIASFTVQTAHGNGKDLNGDQRRVMDIKDPMPTVCGNRGDIAVVTPYVLPQHGGHPPRDIDDPLSTVTTTSRGIALVSPYVLPQHSGGQARPTSEPLPTVATGGAISLVEPYVVKFYGTATTAKIDEPLDTVTGTDRFGLTVPAVTTATEIEIPVDSLVTIGGKRYPLALIDGVHCLICDMGGQLAYVAIYFRMLTPAELAKAQGFRSDHQFSGNKTEVVKQIGNAVPYHTARALVLAALSQQEDISQFLEGSWEAAA